MKKYAVGAPFPDKVSRSVFQYDIEGNKIIIFEDELDKREIRAFKENKIKFGLYVNGPIIFMLVDINGFLGWSDLPYSYHLVHDEAKHLPPLDYPAGMGLPIHLYLVDADSKELLAMRLIGSSREFSIKLAEAIHTQAAQPFDAIDYDCLLAKVRNTYTSDQMAKMAIAKYSSYSK